MKPVASVLHPGIHCTIQDFGRAGYRSMGVPAGGALDWISHYNANISLGNAATKPTLEIIGSGLILKIMTYGHFSVFGAEMELRINGVRHELNQPHIMSPGDVISFGKQVRGHVNYLAIKGGFMADKVLGSAATLPRTNWGGLKGRILQKGDLLKTVESDETGTTQPILLTDLEGEYIRFMVGPESSSESSWKLQEPLWRKGLFGDRIGHQIENGSTIRLNTHDIQSSPIAPGVIQLPASGQPIVLLNDSASTGGYARIGTIIAADLPRFCQIPPGKSFRLKEVSPEQALTALKPYEMAFSLQQGFPISQ